jgi:hypothetical protein
VQIRYMVLMFSSYPLALVFRFALHPNHTPVILRYAFSVVMGILIGLACFGWDQMCILFGVIVVSYLILLLVPPRYAQW